MRRESGVPPNPGSAQRIIDLLVRFESQQLSYRLPVNVDISRTEPPPPFIGSAITLWYKSTSPLEKECAGSTQAFVRAAKTFDYRDVTTSSGVSATLVLEAQ